LECGGAATAFVLIIINSTAESGGFAAAVQSAPMARETNFGQA
jgi:hypothetical protein